MAGSHAETDVLNIVLQNASTTLNARDVCALLCTSKQTADTTRHRFRAHAALTFRPTTLQQAKRFSRWLVRNVSLLQSLQFAPKLPWEPSPYCSYGEPGRIPPSLLKGDSPDTTEDTSSLDHDDTTPDAHDGTAEEEEYQDYYSYYNEFEDEPEPEDDNAAAGSILAKGLAAADAAGSLAHLRSFICGTHHAVLPSLLKSLPSGLTRLDLAARIHIFDACGLSAADIGLCFSSLIAKMSGLRSLKLYIGSEEYMDCIDTVYMKPGVFSHLTKLSQLDLSGFVVYNNHIQQLPTSLERLLLCNYWYNGEVSDEDAGPKAERDELDFRCLAALTELSTSSGNADFKVPSSLVHLHDDIYRFGHLLHLTSLQRLDCCFDVDPAAYLADSLTTLTHLYVRLHDDSPASQEEVDLGASHTALAGQVDALFAAGIAGAIRKVLLTRSLSDKSKTLYDAALVQQLARLPNLAHLIMEYVDLGVDGASELSSLASLTCLDLKCRLQDSAAGSAALVSALKHLPLHTLDVSWHVNGQLDEVSSAVRVAFFSGIAGLSQLRDFRYLVYDTYALNAEVQPILKAATQLTQIKKRYPDTIYNGTVTLTFGEPDEVATLSMSA